MGMDQSRIRQLLQTRESILDRDPYDDVSDIDAELRNMGLHLLHFLQLRLMVVQ